MIGALALIPASLADPQYDRLFGDAPLPPAAAAPAEDPGLPGWVVPVGVAGLAVAAAFHLRQRRGAPAAGQLRVLQRQPTGDRGSLLLVEVGVTGGERRRLLVGTGGGPPVLVADLGSEDGAEGWPEPAFARRLADEVLAERQAGRAAARPPVARYLHAEEGADEDPIPAFPLGQLGETVAPPVRVAAR